MGRSKPEKSVARPRDRDRITSLSQFVSAMTDLCASERRGFFWFRGHNEIQSDPLLPVILRKSVTRRVQGADEDQQEIAVHLDEDRGKYLIQEFRRMGAPHLSPDASIVDIYFMAQHYGLPTRLLDWTANPLAALLFAAHETPDKDAEVLAVIPGWGLTFGDKSESRSNDLPWPPISQSHPLVQRTVAYLFDEGEQPSERLILPIRPHLGLQRMWQQDACFTLHMPDCPTIQSLARRYRIPAAAKPRLVKELDAVGVNIATLFPDLDHVAAYLRRLRGFDRG